MKLKKIFYIPLSLIMGLVAFLTWLESGKNTYEIVDDLNRNEARGVEKEKQEKFKPLNSSENIIPLSEIESGK